MRNLDFFERRKVVLGLVHLQPLPGTPHYREGSFNEILDRALNSARALRDGGADGCLVQTVDRVYSVEDTCDPARAIAMGLIVQAIAQEGGGDFHVGVQLMRNALKASFAVAKVAGGSFIRAGAAIGATLSDDGIITANPLDVIEYRERIKAGSVKMIADIHSMQFRWLGEPKPVERLAKVAQKAGADAISLGDPDDQKTLAMITAVRQSLPDLPIILAGYTNHNNVKRLLADANGVFVGTCLEQGGWGGQIDVERVKAYVDIVRGLE
jgi:membrane complex biogenesis BtpA family protein